MRPRSPTGCLLTEISACTTPAGGPPSAGTSTRPTAPTAASTCPSPWPQSCTAMWKRALLSSATISPGRKPSRKSLRRRKQGKMQQRRKDKNCSRNIPTNSYILLTTSIETHTINTERRHNRRKELFLWQVQISIFAWMRI